ncbi:MAG: monovalent cation/H+ antiporter subunit [Neobacillus sp.]|jgi:multicomponent Na+:H+ antiporter subunit E|nr:monovalent cation/H+ antiporter subunit [Neobacillus sp.]
MSFQLLLNVILAFAWMFLKNDYSSSAFFIGYLLGLLILLVYRPFFKERFYLLRVWALVSLLVLFLKELILSNISVLKHILKPKLDIQPGIFALETELTRDWEITTLANLITLTPGTLVVDVSLDSKILYIHAIDVPEKHQAIESIKNSFEKAIMEVSK